MLILIILIVASMFECIGEIVSGFKQADHTDCMPIIKRIAKKLAYMQKN